MCIRDRGCGVVKASRTLVLALDFHKGIDGRKCLASWVKPLLIINVHGVDDPFFDMIKIHHGKGSRDIYNKLKAEFRIGPDNDIQPM